MRRVDPRSARALAERIRLALETGRPVRPADVLTAVRTATRHGCPEVGCAVACLAWDVAGPRWWRELARDGEEAAIAARRADLLVGLLHRSATVFAGAGEWAAAELAWLRVLAIAEERGDQRRFEDTLQLLGATYLAWGRPHRAVDVLLELAAARERDGDPVGHADALTTVGRAMTEARRPDAAISYLARAEKELARLGAADTARPAVRRHASVLADLAAAHVARGSINTARTLLRQALTLVVDIDEEVAERIRARQATLPDARTDPRAPEPTQREAGFSTDRSRGDTRPS